MNWTFLARLAAVIVCAGGCSQPLPAAPVNASFFLSPTSILPGEETALNLQLSLDPALLNAEFGLGSVTFNFGDGKPPETLSVTPGETSQDFDSLHAYIDLKSYIVSYSAGGIFLADFSSEAARASCARPAIAKIKNRKARHRRQVSCLRNPTISFVVRLPQAWTIEGSETLTVAALATPLPAALPLFASGAAFLGWLARRRRNKASIGLTSSLCSRVG